MSRCRRPRCASNWADGSKGVIQSLGNAFGALHQPPYLHLDGDDRSGAVPSGENLTVNPDHKHAFRRILIFVTICEGARSFADLHATVTLQPQCGAAVDFSLDEYTVPSMVCALALITHHDGDLVVRREARYLVPERGFSPQRTVDHAYGWGMNWTPGRKWPRAGDNRTGRLTAARERAVRRYGPSRPRPAPCSAAPRNRPS